MTVFVDYLYEYPEEMIDRKARKYGKVWSHLFGDDIDELHLFAKGIGLRRDYFQNRPTFPHYDLTPNKRNIAILRGAKEVHLIDFLREQRMSKEVIE